MISLKRNSKFEFVEAPGKRVRRSLDYKIWDYQRKLIIDDIKDD